jgi:hypothetical protein
MYCSSCGREYRPDYTECADCHVPLVEQLSDNMPRRRAVPRFPTIPKLPDNRPLLLKVMPYLAFILAGELVLVLVCGLFDIGTFTRDGKIVSSREFLSQAALPLSALVLIFFAVSFAFWREAQWSRHLLIGCLLLAAIWQLWSGDGRTELGLALFTLDLAIPSGLVYFVFACWYLYAKSNVRAYYRNLKTNSGAEVQPPNTGPQADA